MRIAKQKIFLNKDAFPHLWRSYAYVVFAIVLEAKVDSSNQSGK